MNSKLAVGYLREVLSDVLNELPFNHPQRERVLKGLADTERFAMEAPGAAKPAPDAMLVTVGKPGLIRTYATLPGYTVEKGFRLLLEQPLFIRNAVHSQPFAYQLQSDSIKGAAFNALLKECVDNPDNQDLYHHLISFIDSHQMPKREQPRNEEDEQRLFAHQLKHDLKANLTSLKDSAGAGPEQLEKAARLGWNARSRWANSLTVNAHQLRCALDLANPDGDTDPDQMETEVTLVKYDAFMADNIESGMTEACPAGVYLYWTEYPEEGVMLLDEGSPLKN